MFANNRIKAGFHIPAFFAFLFVLFIVNIVLAQESIKEVQAIGTGTVQDKGIVAAKDQAISNGLANAVARAVEDYIPSDVLSGNFKALDEAIFNMAGDYIRNYRVLTENKSESAYRVYIQASVLSRKIHEKLSELEILLADTDLPKILFLVAERNINELLPVYWWGDDPSFVQAESEAAMAAIFEEKGYAVKKQEAMFLYETSIDDQSTRGTSPDGKTPSPVSDYEEGSAETIVYNNPFLSNQEAVRIGYRLKADIVVVGSAQADIVPNTMGSTIRSFKGNISLRAVDVETGREIASVRQDAITVGADEIAGGKDALTEVGKIAGEALASQIALSWKKAPSVAGKVDIVVQGTGNLGSYVSFRRSLQEIPGVASLRIMEMKPDEATLSVDYSGGAHSLAEALMRKTFENFGVNIYEMPDESLKVEIVPEKPKPGSSQ